MEELAWQENAGAVLGLVSTLIIDGSLILMRYPRV